MKDNYEKSKVASNKNTENLLLRKFASLLNVKTIVTFFVMSIFTILAICETIETQLIMQIVTMVVAFYFGTQHEKNG